MQWCLNILTSIVPTCTRTCEWQPGLRIIMNWLNFIISLSSLSHTLSQSTSPSLSKSDQLWMIQNLLNHQNDARLLTAHMTQKRKCVLKVIKHLKLHLLYLLLYFYYLLHFFHIRKDPAIKRTSYLKSQSMITYILVLTLLLLCIPCTFNFHMQYSSLICHALRALDT